MNTGHGVDSRGARRGHCISRHEVLPQVRGRRRSRLIQGRSKLPGSGQALREVVAGDPAPLGRVAHLRKEDAEKRLLLGRGEPPSHALPKLGVIRVLDRLQRVTLFYQDVMAAPRQELVGGREGAEQGWRVARHEGPGVVALDQLEKSLE